MTDNKISAATGLQVKDPFLFSPKRLSKLSSWKDIEDDLKERELSARPLKSTDFENGYIDLLSQLTEVGDISEDDFVGRFNLMKTLNEINEHYAIVVIEDITTRKVVGAASLIMELKFIHQCAMRGRIEEVVVLDQHRGKKIGETVVRILVDLAREAYNCYKISLDCSDDLIKFYEKNGLNPGKNMLSRYFNN